MLAAPEVVVCSLERAGFLLSFPMQASVVVVDFVKGLEVVVLQEAVIVPAVSVVAL